MRILACVIGIVGALSGIFFAQLVISVGMMLGIVTSATQGNELDLGQEFYVGLAALGLYAVGLAGAVVVPLRAFLGGALLLVAAIGGSIATVVINGAPSTQSTGAFVNDVFPYIGPVLLFIATGLTATQLRTAMAGATVAGGSAVATTNATPSAAVAPSHAQLASAVSMPLLTEPRATASTMRSIEPGTTFDSFEQHGEFVRVRGEGFEGYLPAWSVRRL